MRPGVLVASLLLFPLLFSPPASAQTEGLLYQFSVTGQTEYTLSPRNSVHNQYLYFKDDSRDVQVPGGAGQTVLPHHVAVSFTVASKDAEGWVFQIKDPGFQTGPGMNHSVPIEAQVTNLAVNPRFSVLVNFTITTDTGQTFYRYIPLLFKSDGLKQFDVQRGTDPPYLLPRETFEYTFQVHNNLVYSRGFRFAITNNDCGTEIAPPAGVVLEPKEFKDVTFTVQAPAATAIFGDSCTITVQTEALESRPGGAMAPSGITQPVNITIHYSGIYVDPMLIFQLIALAILLFLLILFLRRRKERIEERLLGKPEKPWLIPVEQVYLRELKARDPRAWYIVRHYLMEEEYRSALAWFKSYKAATKGDRKKEHVILKQEGKYAKWKQSWAKALAKPAKRADAFEAQLQRKLDKKARKGSKRLHKKHRKEVSKIRAAHSRNQTRALEAWEKEAAKAAKKGRPVPPQPAMTQPQLPPEPSLTGPKLTDHKWSKKAARFRKRMVKRQGDLEVKFEKADARYLRKLRRKVSRLARKLDDPTFVAEHPLLRDAAPQK